MKKSKIIGLLTLMFLLGLTTYNIYPEEKLTNGQKADKIIINKADHELLLFYKEELIASYKVSLGRKGLDKKTKEGDNLTPEGRFKGKKMVHSQYHKAIGVGEWGECCDVLVHGLGAEYGRFKRFHRWRDWTKGCIALTNDEIDEIYKAVNDDLIIEINP
jgi:murein L,D-transpeptidase YafK